MIRDDSFLAGLLPEWGLSPDARLTRPEQGVNNQTFLVQQGDGRFVLRVGRSGSVGQVRAEHRVLGRLRRAGLPFEVPEPLPARDGGTLIETADGPVTVCRWIPGVRPDLEDIAMIERFGRAAGLLGDALADVPLEDVVDDWLRDPLQVPGVTDLGEVCDDLRAAGVSAGETDVLVAAARRVGQEWSEQREVLPRQVIHGDLGGSNTLVDPDTGRISALLDFEFVGSGWRVQDFLVAMYNSPVLDAHDWPLRVEAFARGYASVCRLGPAEVAALPGLLRARSFGSAAYRAGQWRAGKARLDEVTGRIRRLQAVTDWLATEGDRFQKLMATADSR